MVTVGVAADVGNHTMGHVLEKMMCDHHSNVVAFPFAMLQTVHIECISVESERQDNLVLRLEPGGLTF